MELTGVQVTPFVTPTLLPAEQTPLIQKNSPTHSERVRTCLSRAMENTIDFCLHQRSICGCPAVIFGAISVYCAVSVNHAPAPAATIVYAVFSGAIALGSLYMCFQR